MMDKKLKMVEFDLKIIKNGVNWINDLVGNAGSLVRANTTDETKKILEKNESKVVYNYEDDCYYTTQSTYDWWNQYIDEMEEADKKESELMETAEDAEEKQQMKEEILHAMSGSDMENEQVLRLEKINELIAEKKGK